VEVLRERDTLPRGEIADASAFSDHAELVG
jgi:hypothetical protein